MRIQKNAIVLFFIGFGSILSQILLVREFLVSFYGNELSIGIVFACWLIWIAIGSMFGNKIIKRNFYSLFSILIVITPVIAVFQILAVKFVRALLHAPVGEFLSMAELLGFASVVLSVGCILWGMLFTLGAKLLASEEQKLWFGVNKAYVLESLGSVVGGLLFSFILGSILSTFQILSLIILIAWGITLWISFINTKWQTISSLIFVTIGFAALLRPIRTLEHQIEAYQWTFINDKLTFVNSIDTKYQNLSLLHLENQYTVYADGRPAYNIPDTYHTEIFVHSIMVHHADAKRVLIIGGGFNGILKEILKYPIQKVDYIEIDPSLLPFVEPVLDRENRQSLRDPRVENMYGDGRDFIHRATQKYDVILLNTGEPSTASLNRFFTIEFYQQCTACLTSNGMLALTFPSSAEYIADELKEMNASIYHSLKKVFNNVLIIPGDHAVLIGSKNKYPLTAQPDSLARRFEALGVSTQYFSKYMFEELMLPERVKYVTHTLEKASITRLNTDLDPVTYYFDLLLWNRYLTDDNSSFTHLTRKWIFAAGCIVTGLFLIIMLFRFKNFENNERYMLSITMGCSGYIGMALNLLLLLIYQETFGSVYEMVGAMIAANMLGLALGALLAVPLLRKFKEKTLLLTTLLVLTGFTLLLPMIAQLLFAVRSIPLSFLAMTSGGSVIGILFGVINSRFLQYSSNVGSIYAFDIFGSSIGALTTCSFLLPVLGIQETTYFFMLVLLPAIISAVLIRRVQ